MPVQSVQSVYTLRADSLCHYTVGWHCTRSVTRASQGTAVEVRRGGLAIAFRTTTNEARDSQVQIMCVHSNVYVSEFLLIEREAARSAYGRVD